MRTGLLIALVLSLVLGLLLVAAAPLLVMRDLRNAIQARKPAKVEQLVDFATLKVNVRARTHDKIERDNKGALLEAPGNWVEKKLADVGIDAALTPEGVISMACDKSVKLDPELARGRPCKLEGKLSSVSYLSATRFRLDVRLPEGKSAALILARNKGASHIFEWRVVNALDTGNAS